MDIDNDEPVVYQPTDQEIVEIVKQDEKNEECEDENKAVKERISIDKCIQMTRDSITGLEQRNFITEQEIMSVYLIQTKLIRENPKFQKQATLQQWFKQVVNRENTAIAHSDVENPLPYTLSTLDIQRGLSANPKDPADLDDPPDSENSEDLDVI